MLPNNKIKDLLESEDYQSMIDMFFEQNFHKSYLKDSLMKCLNIIGFPDIESFYNSLFNDTEDLLVKKKSIKETSSYLESLFEIKEFFLLFPDEIKNNIKKEIQKLEINRYNKLKLWNKNKLINLDIYYILNNLDEIKEDKRTDVLKFIAKNINSMSTIDFIDTEPKNSFINTVLDKVKDKKIAKNIINVFYKNIDIKSHMMKELLDNELKVSSVNLLKNIDIVESEKNEMLNNVFISHLFFSKEKVPPVFFEEFIKKTESKKRIININEYIFKENINESNFNNLMSIFSKNEINIKIMDISLNNFLNKMKIDNLYTYKENIEFGDNFLRNNILLNIETITKENVYEYVKQAIAISRLNKSSKVISSKHLLLSPNKISHIIVSKTHNPENREKIKEIIKHLDNDKINEELPSDTFRYIPSVVMLDLLQENFNDFNEIINIIDTIVKDDKEKEKVIHAHLFRTMKNHSDKNDFLEVIKNSNIKLVPELNIKILSFLKMERNDFLEKIYNKDNEFYSFSLSKNISDEKYDKILKEVVPFLEKNIIENKIKQDNPKEILIGKKRL